MLWPFLLGEYGGPVRHVWVKMVWGIESLVLDAPGEDDWGQCVRQLFPKYFIFRIQYEGLGNFWTIIQRFLESCCFTNSKARSAGAVIIFVSISMWHLLPGVAGKPGMLPSSGLARLAWNPKSLSSSAIACGMEICRCNSNVVQSTCSLG